MAKPAFISFITSPKPALKWNKKIIQNGGRLVVFRQNIAMLSKRPSYLKSSPIHRPSLPLENKLTDVVKARLHRRFLLRFSPFGGCEGVDYLMMMLSDSITWNIYNWSTPSHPPKGENRNWNRSKNRPCKWALMPK
jgi:hypothetical protein